MSNKRPASPLLLDGGDLPEYPSNTVLTAVLDGLGAEPVGRASSGRERLPKGATVVVPYPAHRRVFRHAIANIGRSVRIVAVPLVLLHDSRVTDRQEVVRWHPRAMAYRLADLLLGRCSTLVVSDTEAHAAFLARRLRRPVRWARLGSGVEVLRPDLLGSGPAEFDGALRFVHYGNFFPIQGIDTILHAFDGLGAEYRLDLIGNAPDGLRTPPNVTLHPPMPPADLYTSMASGHALIGQFGDTPQRSLVVPTKIYDALALGLPVISASGLEIDRHRDLPALDLVPPDDPDALAAAARSLMEAAAAGDLTELGRSAATAYREHFSVACSRDDWCEILERGDDG